VFAFVLGGVNIREDELPLLDLPLDGGDHAGDEEEERGKAQAAEAGGLAHAKLAGPLLVKHSLGHDAVPVLVSHELARQGLLRHGLLGHVHSWVFAEEKKVWVNKEGADEKGQNKNKATCLQSVSVDEEGNTSKSEDYNEMYSSSPRQLTSSDTLQT